MKKLFPYIVLAVISVILYVLTIRGNVGVPSVNDITPYPAFVSGTPFESSQEGSRYAMVLALFNDHSVAIDKYYQIGVPDVGKIKGHYFSLFPPGASVLALPLYIIGLKIGATQLMTFLVSTIFAFLTMLLMVRFSKKLNLHWSTALFSAIAFGFATNAWGYSVTLVAHLISAFCILGGIYLAYLTEKKWWHIALVWFLYSAAVFIDFPNLFIYIPIVGLMSLNAFEYTESPSRMHLKINFRYLITPIVFVALMSLYGYYNYVNFGKASSLSNTLPRVESVANEQKQVEHVNRETDAFNALETRNMLGGFQSFLISTDRGVLIYSPVILLFVFGVPLMKKKLKLLKVSLVAVAATCLTLYTMFGDPYGGWAFGSRYMIAIMPELCILAAYGLQKMKRYGKWRYILTRLVFSIVFIYSASVSLLAPLTTNVIPPTVEARYIGLDSNYIINIRMLQDSHLNSFFYNNIIHEHISGVAYYGVIIGFVSIIGLVLIWFPRRKEI
jgi:hypothetical protein